MMDRQCSCYSEQWMSHRYQVKQTFFINCILQFGMNGINFQLSNYRQVARNFKIRSETVLRHPKISEKMPTIPIKQGEATECEGGCVGEGGEGGIKQNTVVKNPTVSNTKIPFVVIDHIYFLKKTSLKGSLQTMGQQGKHRFTGKISNAKFSAKNQCNLLARFNLNRFIST